MQTFTRTRNSSRSRFPIAFARAPLRRAAVLAALGLAAVPAPRAEVVISSFQDGIVHWTNAPAHLEMFSVEWLPSLASNTWQRDWSAQASIVATQAAVAAPVPRFYRVAQGFDERALDGVWMIYHADGYTCMRAHGQGLIHEFGSTRRAPAGYYAVQSNGAFQATLLDNEERIVLTGQCVQAGTWSYVYLNQTNVIRKVANPGALAGAWRGAIGPYTNLRFQVRSDGFIPAVTNLIDVASGTAYMDDSNHVAMAFFTGADTCTSAWSRIDVRGQLVGGTNIIGDYDLDWDLGWITMGVNLRRP